VRIRTIGVLAVLGAAVTAASPTLAVADEPQAENVSQQVFDEARIELEKRIASKSIAGGAHMVVRNGKLVYLHVAGVSDIEDRTPLGVGA
jgi:CubicO group peptidase (beta-lactamase class C family)